MLSSLLPAAFNLDGNKYRDKYAMLCIHMWMTLVRLRSEGKPGKSLTQNIYDNFQEDVEHRVRAAGVKVDCWHWLSSQNGTILPHLSSIVQ